MPIIQKLAKDKGQFYWLWLSSGEKIQVSEDLLVRHRLLKDQEISSELVQELRTAGARELGFQAALNYLSYQLRTRQEMSQYLKKKEIPATERQAILARLEEMSLLDDVIYSESFVRTAIKTGDKGPNVLQQQLKQKGVADEAIQQGLAHYTFEEQVAVALKTAQKAAQRYSSKSFQEKKQKIKLHLMQKGFNQEVITLALEELALEKDPEQETELLAKQGAQLARKYQRLAPAQRVLKMKQALYQKGFDYDLIQQYLSEKEWQDDE